MILWSTYAIGVLVVFIHLLIEGFKTEDEIKLSDIFESFIASFGSWIVYVLYLADKYGDIVIWRRKKD